VELKISDSSDNKKIVTFHKSSEDGRVFMNIKQGSIDLQIFLPPDTYSLIGDLFLVAHSQYDRLEIARSKSD